MRVLLASRYLLNIIHGPPTTLSFNKQNKSFLFLSSLVIQSSSSKNKTCYHLRIYFFEEMTDFPARVSWIFAKFILRPGVSGNVSGWLSSHLQVTRSHQQPWAVTVGEINWVLIEEPTFQLEAVHLGPGRRGDCNSSDRLFWFHFKRVEAANR